jgi:DNA-binding transcriptional LysR family regulator
MDKFDCLKVFSRVAQLGSFTAAANELNTTQSAVSKKIAWLESECFIVMLALSA